jgi:hypothetical protein
MGLMAPSPLNHQVKHPSMGMARPPPPACLTKTMSPQRTLSLSSPSQPSLNRGGKSLVEHHAATVLQCWKRRLWLCCWFDQQAKLKEKCLRLQTLCHGASTYTRLVGVNCHPPPTPTIKPSDPKVSNHPFCNCGQQLPLRKRARRPKQRHRRPGQRHWPRAPVSGGGALCMPLCFWATQTTVVAATLPAGAGRLQFTPYLPPHKAATAIQHAYRSYLRDRHYWQQVVESTFSLEVNKLECNMALAMHDLKDSDDLVYTSQSGLWLFGTWTAMFVHM